MRLKCTSEPNKPSRARLRLALALLRKAFRERGTMREVVRLGGGSREQQRAAETSKGEQRLASPSNTQRDPAGNRGGSRVAMV